MSQVISNDTDKIDINEEAIPTVFISYRSSTDSQLAAALKKLIEIAVEPSPIVFVSGEGGLRPSQIGYKQQIQSASHKVKVFIGLITDASKDREWIYFEAGAAWGQGKVYAPVLIGTKPEDLPNTICDYQAIRGDDKTGIKKLMGVIAELSSGVVKDRFGQKLLGFSRAIDCYLNGSILQSKTAIEDTDLIELASKLADDGDADMANTKFEEAEAEAGNDNERLCLVKIKKIEALCKPDERIRQIAKLDNVLKNTANYNYHMYVTEKNPVKEAEYLEKVITFNHEPMTTVSKYYLAKNVRRRGLTSKATDLLYGIIRSHPGENIAYFSARELAEMQTDGDALSRLMILLTGFMPDMASGYSYILELASKNKWNILRYYAAYKMVLLNETVPSHNELGRVRHAAGCVSLAYESYSAAAENGESVGLSNMALLHYQSPIAYLGLKILRGHKGKFEVQDPSYVYRTWSDLEKAYKNEVQKEAKIVESGENILESLSVIAEYGLRGNAINTTNPFKGMFVGTANSYYVDNDSLKQTDGTSLICDEITPLPFGSSLRIYREDNKNIIVAHDGDQVHGVIVKLIDEDASLQWLEYHPVNNQMQVGA